LLALDREDPRLRKRLGRRQPLQIADRLGLAPEAIEAFRDTLIAKFHAFMWTIL
jgi:hypothetical protein